MIEKIDNDNYKISKESKILIKRYFTNTLLLKSYDLKEENLKKYLEELKKRKLYKNIRPENLKQLIKKILLMINVKLYLKMR